MCVHTADDARKAEIEKAKQEQLKDGEFKDSLASESESVVCIALDGV